MLLSSKPGAVPTLMDSSADSSVYIKCENRV